MSASNSINKLNQHKLNYSYQPNQKFCHLSPNIVYINVCHIHFLASQNIVLRHLFTVSPMACRKQSGISILLLIFTLSSIFGSRIQAEARHLLETTLPEVRKLEIPTLPKPELPTLPKPEVPTLPKPELPTLPKLEIPTLPKPELPTLPKPELPTLPKPEVPELPKFPELPKLTVPEVPKSPWTYRYFKWTVLIIWKNSRTVKCAKFVIKFFQDDLFIQSYMLLLVFFISVWVS